MINRSVSVDFDVPKIVRNTMASVEESFEADGEYGPFMDWVSSLDNVCKECYVNGAITKRQWETIMSRYPMEE